jgi:hypothetical protein
MASKKTKSVTKKGPRQYVVHKKLEEPVHNLVGYLVLLMFAVTTLIIAMTYLPQN